MNLSSPNLINKSIFPEHTDIRAFPLGIYRNNTQASTPYAINVIDPRLSSGWLVERGIYNLVKDFMPETNAEEKFYSDSGYVPFSYLDGVTAQKILSRLPRSMRAERQNLAPSVDELLQAAIKWDPLIKLNGYLIGPKREDERISIDSFYLLDSGIITHKDSHPWTEINRYFNLSDQAFPPDSCEYYSQGKNYLDYCREKALTSPSRARIRLSTAEYKTMKRWKLWWD